MKRIFALLALFLALAAAPLQALAANYFQDNANLFSQSAKNQATSAIDDLVKRTGKEILVITVPSLNGQDARTAAENAFRQNRTDGVLFYISRDDRRLELVAGQATQQALPRNRLDQIRQTMLDDFRANNQQGYDKGLLDGVNGVRSALAGAAPQTTSGSQPVRQGGPNWVLIGLLIVGALLIVWVITGVMRARQLQQQASYGQPGYGQPGYGYGGGPGFGGGGFMSGLLGGLGGALLGNALFNAFRPHDTFSDVGGHDAGGFADQGGGWQTDDAGQVGDVSGGSWGDTGGGDWGGGDVGFGGDGGGGGGGDW